MMTRLNGILSTPVSTKKVFNFNYEMEIIAYKSDCKAWVGA